MKSARLPRFFLYSESKSRSESGAWCFVLRTSAGKCVESATGEEPSAAGGRLELLAVVRGLEALDQPSCVTLVTPSRYVLRGLRYGLDEWRANDWRWERFGRNVPIKNCDLWRRIDQALRFHQVRWVHVRTDPAHSVPPPKHLRRAARGSVPTSTVLERLTAWISQQQSQLAESLQPNSVACQKV